MKGGRCLITMLVMFAVALVPMTLSGGYFYAKSGKENAEKFGSAYNSRYGVLDGANIRIPDTREVPVPEPGSLALFGGGLISIAVWGRRRFRK